MKSFEPDEKTKAELDAQVSLAGNIVRISMLGAPTEEQVPRHTFGMAMLSLAIYALRDAGTPPEVIDATARMVLAEVHKHEAQFGRRGFELALKNGIIVVIARAEEMVPAGTLKH